jgi:hypothetical protein
VLCPLLSVPRWNVLILCQPPCQISCYSVSELLSSCLAMEDSTKVLQNIKAYADSSAKLEQERLSIPVSPAIQRDYEKQLDRTVQRLLDQVREHEAALQKVCLS